MNAPIRRLAVVVAAMFAALLISTTYIQFFQADTLREMAGNRRTLLDQYGRDRGAILVDGTPIAESEPTDDDLRWIRTYSQGQLYAHVTGYYSFTYGAGLGLERSENALLSGSADSLFYRRLPDLVTGREPTGATLEITIDPRVQRAAAQALGDRRGAVVALDPRTGAILAMVSHPTYDPNTLSSHNLSAVQQSYETLNEDASRPLVNRAIAGDLYPPGSVFKLVVAAAALESNEFNPDSELPSPLRYTLPGTSTSIPNFGGSSCSGGETTSLFDSVRVSCNTSFAWLAGELGADQLNAQAEAFGFGQPLQVPLPVTPSRYPVDADDAQVGLTGIGQYDVRVTPLQVAMIAASIANDGVLMQPHLVDTVRDKDLDPIDTTSAQELSTPISVTTAQELTDMMVAVVDAGSGGAAALPGIQVAGKTGTAEFGTTGAAHAWFTGFAPADNPTIAVAVLVESATADWTGETGGVVAAPIARAVLEAGVNP
ncbi:peptidoglycan D,D-transpeptidase FtsI family protein [Ornithinimicrobium cryptoxanthini]|uniref:Penicillin-binding protein 2 n=1 Tax=Ornithinimicrobium cryptoxanthini TaxID=2934161 RepID=A0ABY4YHZ3_9MICO|nr:penicillin-binding protein 2 [Ornithinimicrobium cryptoxanthini]USQ76381.1 penicillin-binding protein 2 [Ornithinimicrobium cryptoxanthini]